MNPPPTSQDASCDKSPLFSHRGYGLKYSLLPDFPPTPPTIDLSLPVALQSFFKHHNMSSPPPPPAPNRQDRAQCWSDRDAFFKCLNVNDVNVPPQYEKDGAGSCSTERKAYEGSCARSWVSGVEMFTARQTPFPSAAF